MAGSKQMVGFIPSFLTCYYCLQEHSNRNAQKEKGNDDGTAGQESPPCPPSVRENFVEVETIYDWVGNYDNNQAAVNWLLCLALYLTHTPSLQQQDPQHTTGTTTKPKKKKRPPPTSLNRSR